MEVSLRGRHEWRILLWQLYIRRSVTEHCMVAITAAVGSIPSCSNNCFFYAIPSNDVCK